MNCQSHLARLFLSSCREEADEFKTSDKEGGHAGFLLGNTQKSFIRLVMVVQFYQITAEISSMLENEMNCDLTSRSLLLSTLRSSREELLEELRPLHYLKLLETGGNKDLFPVLPRGQV